MSYKHTSALIIMSAGLWLGGSALADERDPAPETHQADPAPGQLDLRAPDITKLYTPEQLAHVLASKSDSIENVEVEARRDSAPPVSATPEIWGGIAAPLWALLHPTQAWRILAPLPPDQTQDMDAAEANSVEREPVIRPH